MKGARTREGGREKAMLHTKNDIEPFWQDAKGRQTPSRLCRDGDEFRHSSEGGTLLNKTATLNGMVPPQTGWETPGVPSSSLEKGSSKGDGRILFDQARPTGPDSDTATAQYKVRYERADAERTPAASQCTLVIFV